MALTAYAAMWFLPFALPICVWVAWNDMKFMKIPNKAVIALFVVFAVIGLIALPFGDYLWRYLHLVIILVIGFVMNMARMIGAGDAKFAAVMAPFVPYADTGRFLILFATILVAAFITHRISKARPAMRPNTGDWVSWSSPYIILDRK